MFPITELLSKSSVQFYCPKCGTGPENVKFIRDAWGSIQRTYSLMLNDAGEVVVYDEKEDCDAQEIRSEKGYCLSCGFDWDIEIDD